MARIPLELFSYILQNIQEKRTLCPVARTSRSLQHEAERLIYRDISIVGLNGIISFCKRLFASTRLPRYVTSLSLTAQIMPNPLRATFDRLLSQALKRLTNLRSLHFIIMSSPRFPISMFGGCTFKLIVFKDTFSSMSKDLSPFVANQDKLRHLEFSGGPFPYPFAPELAVLNANCGTALALLRNRPVTHLRIPEILPIYAHHFSLSMGPLRALDLQSQRFGVTRLSFHLDLLPDLELLTGITVATRQDLENLYQILHVLKKISVLSLLFTHGHPEETRDSTKEIILKLRNARPTLHTIHLVNPFEYRNCQRGVALEMMWEKGMQEIRWYDAETIATPLMRDLWEESVAALDLMCHGNSECSKQSKHEYLGVTI